MNGYEQVYIPLVMSTTIHLPAQLLAAVDRQARELEMSCNRYIVRALATETAWSAAFIAELAATRADAEGRRALEDLRAAVSANRTRKDPPRL